MIILENSLELVIREPLSMKLNIKTQHLVVFQGFTHIVPNDLERIAKNEMLLPISFLVYNTIKAY